MSANNKPMEEVTKFGILQMKIDGLNEHEIAEQAGCSVAQVRVVIKESVDDVRQQKNELIHTQFMVHYRRTEKMYKLTNEMLDTYFKKWKQQEKQEISTADDAWVDYHAKIMECIVKALLILTRQASLLHLDQNKTASPGRGGLGGAGTNDWLADPNTPETEIVSYARRVGLRIPVGFSGRVDPCHTNVS